MSSNEKPKGKVAEFYFLAGDWGKDAKGFVASAGGLFGNGAVRIKTASGISTLVPNEIVRFSPHPRYSTDGQLRTFEFEVRGGKRAVVSLPAANVSDLPSLFPHAALNQRSVDELAQVPAVDYDEAEFGERQERHAESQKIILVISGLIAAVVLGVVVLGFASGAQGSRSVASTNASPVTSLPLQRPVSDEWYSGGNLHSANGAAWKRATHANRLATAADYTARMIGSARIEQFASFDEVRPLANELKVCIDEATRGTDSNTLQVTEIAAACAVLMGWG